MTDPGAIRRDFLRFRDHGDAAALARVFDATARDLLMLAEQLTVQPSDAEDLLQTTFLQAMRDAKQFEPRRPVLAWLCGILAHRATDLHRLQSRRRAASLDEPRALERPELDPAAVAASQDLQDHLAEALDRLPEEQRRALLLRLHHGLDSTEIARVLGRPPATVRSWLHRGLRRLRDLLPRSLAAPALFAIPAGPSLTHVRDELLRQAEQLTAAGTGCAPAVSSSLTTSTAPVPSALAPVSLLVMTKSTTALTVGALALLTALLVWAVQPDGSPAPAAAVAPGASASPDSPVDAGPHVPAIAANETHTEAARQPTELAGSAEAPARITGRVVRVEVDGLPTPLQEDSPRNAARRNVRLDTTDAPPWPGLTIGWVSPDGTEILPQTRTDANGRFEIVDESPGPPRSLIITELEDSAVGSPVADRGLRGPRVRITPPGGGRGWEDVDLGDLPVRAHFEDLTVQVVDQNGTGVPEVFVFLGAPSAGHGRLETWGGINMVTDEQGFARFRSLAPVGDWLLQLRDLPNGLEFPGAGKQLTRMVRFDPEHPIHRVEVAPPAAAATIRGRVIEPGGLPISRIHVEGWSRDGQQLSAWTDADGNFELSGDSNTAVRLAILPKPLSTRSDGNNRHYEAWRAPEPIAFGTQDLEIVLARRGTLHLEVIDARGLPVESFGYRDIALRPEPDQPAVFAWDELYRPPRHHGEGRAEVSSLRGDHWLLVVPGDSSRFAPAGFLRYTMPTSGVQRLRLTLPDVCTGTVRVVDQDGTPVEGSTVELIVHYTETGTTVGDDLSGLIGLDQNKSSSHFGRPRLVAQGTSNAEGRAALAWRRGGADQLSLRVRGQHPEARVHDLRWQAETPMLVTVLSGSAQAGRVVPDGVLEELARTHDFTRPVAARNRVERPRPRLRLQLENRSLGADGEPLVLGAEREPILVGDDGRFEIPSLPDGRWEVIAVLQTRPETRMPVTEIELPAGRPRPDLLAIDLSPLRPSRLRGRAHHPLGADITKLTLRLRRANWFYGDVALDHDRFDLPGLAPGDYEVSLVAVHADGSSQTLPAAEVLRIPPGQDPLLRDLHFAPPDESSTRDRDR